MVGGLDHDQFALASARCRDCGRAPVQAPGVRLVISTTSMPPTCTAAQSPSGTWVGPKLCQQSRFRAVTVTVASTRLAGGRSGLAAEAQRKFGAQAGIETEPHGDRVPDRPEGGVLHIALDQAAQDGGVVGRRAAAGIVGWVGHDDGLSLKPSAAVDAVVDVQVVGRGACRAWRRIPRRSRWRGVGLRPCRCR